MVTAPQPSVAVATPVTLVRVSPGHWSTRLAGSFSAGGVVSRTVIVCTPLTLLPQPSVAVQVRLMILVPPQLLVTTSENVTVAELQPSWAVAVPVALGAVLLPHSTVKLGGIVITGGVMSRTVMVCVRLTTLPHWS